MLRQGSPILSRCRLRRRTFRCSRLPGAGRPQRPFTGRYSDVIVVQPGAPGSSGAQQATNASASGGGGGGGGGITKARFLTSALGSSQTVTVGQGSAGGASQTTASTAGIQGGSSGVSAFGSGSSYVSGSARVAWRGRRSQRLGVGRLWGRRLGVRDQRRWLQQWRGRKQRRFFVGRNESDRSYRRWGRRWAGWHYACQQQRWCRRAPLRSWVARRRPGASLRPKRRP